MEPVRLQMTLTAQRAAALAPWRPPKGYMVRGYELGDEPQWLGLLALGDFGEWTADKLADWLDKPERRDGSRFIVYNSQELVATAMATQKSVDPLVGAIDCVVVRPDHRGKGLGYGVCAAVVRYLVDRGYSCIVLGTEDWRLPAIKTYLKLGFEPDLFRSDMADRWRKVRDALDWPYPPELANAGGCG